MWKEKSLYGMKLYLKGLSYPKQLIAIDIGTSFSGLSISCSNLKQNSKQLLKSIQGNIKQQKTLNRIAQAIKQQKNVKGLIIGKMDNRMQYTMNKNLIGFINDMKQRQMQIPFCFIDESNSTIEATNFLMKLEQIYRKYGHLHNQKDLKDGLAAINILNRFLYYYNK